MHIDKKIIRISVFLFPWEIDLLQDMADRLKSSSTFIDKTKYTVIFDVTMNVSSYAIDWSQTQIPKEFFINSFNSICNKLNYFVNVDSYIDETTIIFGCVDKRRQSIKKSNDNDYIIWLDLDVHFPIHMLATICNALELITDEYFIITPETVKMWDTTWDVITNYRYSNDHPKQRKFPGNEIFNADYYNFMDYINDNITIQRLENFKFSGGWFNVFSAKLLKLIDIPQSFGSYGLEDTYIMDICNTCRQFRYPVYQYVIRNLIVSEYQFSGHGFNFNFDSLVKNVLPSKDELKRPAIENFRLEQQKTMDKIHKVFVNQMNS